MISRHNFSCRHGREPEFCFECWPPQPRIISCKRLLVSLIGFTLVDLLLAAGIVGILVICGA